MDKLLSWLKTYWRWCMGPSAWWTKVLAWTGVVFVALIILGAVVGGEEQDESQTPGVDEAAAGKPTAVPKAAPTATPLPALGQPVILQRDGWILTVTGVSKTQTTMFLFQTKTALGIYVVVYLTMENTSNKTQALGGDRFTLVDDRGRRYPWYRDGTIGYGQQELGAKINAGLEGPATILFDVPPDATGIILTSLGGFKVTLGNVADFADASTSATAPAPTPTPAPVPTPVPEPTQPPPPTEAPATATQPPPPTVPPPTAAPTARPQAPRFEVVYELSNKRFDGGKSLYVLIDPVDLSNARFKEGIKEIIRTLVAQNGAKTSAEIHDSRSSLITSYKQYGDLSLGRSRTPQEDADQALHYVAAFSGDLRTGPYLNTLYFYIAAFKDHPVVGKYVETIDFNPR